MSMHERDSGHEHCSKVDAALFMSSASLSRAAVQAYTTPAAGSQLSAGSDANSASLLTGDTTEKVSQKPGSNSEFAQRLARRYNPQYSQPNTNPDQRAADIF